MRLGRLALILIALAAGLGAMADEEPSFPDVAHLPAIPQLPDPFMKADGSRIAGVAEWPQQRERLAALVQQYGYGHLPPVPAGPAMVGEEASIHSAALRATERLLKLSIGDSGKISIHLQLTIPDGPGPFPVIVVGDLGWGKQPAAVIAAVAARGYVLVEFDRTEVAPDKEDRSVGVYAVYADCDGGAIAGWAWGYQRVVDWLLTQPNIDPRHIAITGHSRGGKAVLLAGALDERIALTAPNDSGCFGAGCERFAFKGEDLDRIFKRFPYWFTLRLGEFAGRIEYLPFDQHTLKALVAPRALLTTEGLDDAWGNPQGTGITFQAAQVVYRFLNAAERIGIVYRPGGHAHRLEDWQALLDFADLQFFAKQVERRFDQVPFLDDPKQSFAWTAP